MPPSAEPLVVLGIVINGSQQVLLVRRVGEDRWIFPGGQSEPGESEEMTVVREVKEETGVECQTLSFIGKRTHPESSRQISYWRCHALSEVVTVADIGEISEARWMPIGESVNLLGNKVFEPVKNILIALSGKNSHKEYDY